MTQNTPDHTDPMACAQNAIIIRMMEEHHAKHPKHICAGTIYLCADEKGMYFVTTMEPHLVRNFFKQIAACEEMHIHDMGRQN